MENLGFSTVFCSPDPLKSSLLLDINLWKLVVLKKLRPQVLEKIMTNCNRDI